VVYHEAWVEAPGYWVGQALLYAQIPEGRTGHNQARWELLKFTRPTNPHLPPTQADSRLLPHLRQEAKYTGMHGAKTTRFSISGNSVWLSVGDQVQPPAFLFALDTTPANDKVNFNFIITRKDICRQRNTKDLSFSNISP
jgi:hypothetical protein